MNFTELQLDILFKLWRNRCFRRNATLQVDTVVTLAPSHLIGKMRKELEELIRKGVVIKIPIGMETKCSSTLTIPLKLKER